MISKCPSSIQYVLTKQKLFQSFCPTVPGHTNLMRIPDSGKDKSKLPIVSCSDQNGPDAISRVSMGLQDLLGRAGDKFKKYLTEICAILFFLESKAQFAQFSPFVYNKEQMNSRSPEGCHKDARQASELNLVGPSKGLSLSTSGHSARSTVSSTSSRVHARAGTVFSEGGAHCPGRTHRPQRNCPKRRRAPQLARTPPGGRDPTPLRGTRAPAAPPDEPREPQGPGPLFPPIRVPSASGPLCSHRPQIILSKR